MLLKYLLISLFVFAFWRFLSGIVELGRRRGGGRFKQEKEREKPHLRGRDVEDAEFEILPEDEEPPGPG